jgi:hypothetical protein
VSVGGYGIKIAMRRMRPPCCARCERPGRCTAEKGDELAPFEQTKLHALPLPR